jgi:uncharacterized coiled-coil protein SlyX
MADPLAQALEASGGGNIWAVIGLAVSGGLGKYAWDFYKKKADLNFKASDNVRKDVKEEKLLDRKERNEYKDDLKERVAALEVKLETAMKAKEDLLEQVGELRAKLAKIETKLEILLAGGKVAPEPVDPPKQTVKTKKAVAQAPAPAPAKKPAAKQKKNG